MKHTQGPWGIDAGLIMAARDKSGYQQTIASIYGPDGEAWDAETSTRANAALIAAAPDMLAALEASAATLEALQKHLIGNQAALAAIQAKACRANIAKAKGV